MAEEFNSKFANVVSDLNISFDWDVDPEIEAIKDPIKRSIQKFQKPFLVPFYSFLRPL